MARFWERPDDPVVPTTVLQPEPLAPYAVDMGDEGDPSVAPVSNLPTPDAIPPDRAPPDRAPVVPEPYVEDSPFPTAPAPLEPEPVALEPEPVAPPVDPYVPDLSYEDDNSRDAFRPVVNPLESARKLVATFQFDKDLTRRVAFQQRVAESEIEAALQDNLTNILESYPAEVQHLVLEAIIPHYKRVFDEAAVDVAGQLETERARQTRQATSRGGFLSPQSAIYTSQPSPEGKSSISERRRRGETLTYAQVLQISGYSQAEVNQARATGVLPGINGGTQRLISKELFDDTFDLSLAGLAGQAALGGLQTVSLAGQIAMFPLTLGMSWVDRQLPDVSKYWAALADVTMGLVNIGASLTYAPVDAFLEGVQDPKKRGKDSFAIISRLATYIEAAAKANPADPLAAALAVLAYAHDAESVPVFSGAVEMLLDPLNFIPFGLAARGASSMSRLAAKVPGGIVEAGTRAVPRLSAATRAAMATVQEHGGLGAARMAGVSGLRQATNLVPSLSPEWKRDFLEALGASGNPNTLYAGFPLPDTRPFLELVRRSRVYRHPETGKLHLRNDGGADTGPVDKAIQDWVDGEGLTIRDLEQTARSQAVHPTYNPERHVDVAKAMSESYLTQEALGLPLYIVKEGASGPFTPVAIRTNIAHVTPFPKVNDGQVLHTVSTAAQSPRIFRTAAALTAFKNEATAAGKTFEEYLIAAGFDAAYVPYSRGIPGILAVVNPDLLTIHQSQNVTPGLVEEWDIAYKAWQAIRDSSTRSSSTPSVSSRRPVRSTDNSTTFIEPETGKSLAALLDEMKVQNADSIDAAADWWNDLSTPDRETLAKSLKLSKKSATRLWDDLAEVDRDRLVSKQEVDVTPHIRAQAEEARLAAKQTAAAVKVLKTLQNRMSKETDPAKLTAMETQLQEIEATLAGLASSAEKRRGLVDAPISSKPATPKKSTPAPTPAEATRAARARVAPKIGEDQPVPRSSRLTIAQKARIPGFEYKRVEFAADTDAAFYMIGSVKLNDKNLVGELYAFLKRNYVNDNGRRYDDRQLYAIARSVYEEVGLRARASELDNVRIEPMGFSPSKPLRPVRGRSSLREDLSPRTQAASSTIHSSLTDAEVQGIARDLGIKDFSGSRAVLTQRIRKVQEAVRKEISGSLSEAATDGAQLYNPRKLPDALASDMKDLEAVWLKAEDGKDALAMYKKAAREQKFSIRQYKKGLEEGIKEIRKAEEKAAKLAEKQATQATKSKSEPGKKPATAAAPLREILDPVGNDLTPEAKLWTDQQQQVIRDLDPVPAGSVRLYRVEDSASGLGPDAAQYRVTVDVNSKVIKNDPVKKFLKGRKFYSDDWSVALGYAYNVKNPRLIVIDIPKTAIGDGYLSSGKSVVGREVAADASEYALTPAQLSKSRGVTAKKPAAAATVDDIAGESAGATPSTPGLSGIQRQLATPNLRLEVTISGKTHLAYARGTYEEIIRRLNDAGMSERIPDLEAASTDIMDFHRRAYAEVHLHEQQVQNAAARATPTATLLEQISDAEEVLGLASPSRYRAVAVEHPLDDASYLAALEKELAPPAGTAAHHARVADSMAEELYALGLGPPPSRGTPPSGPINIDTSYRGGGGQPPRPPSPPTAWGAAADDGADFVAGPNGIESTRLTVRRDFPSLPMISVEQSNALTYGAGSSSRASADYLRLRHMTADHLLAEVMRQRASIPNRFANWTAKKISDAVAKVTGDTRIAVPEAQYRIVDQVSLAAATYGRVDSVTIPSWIAAGREIATSIFRRKNIWHYTDDGTNRILFVPESGYGLTAAGRRAGLPESPRIGDLLEHSKMYNLTTEQESAIGVFRTVWDDIRAYEREMGVATSDLALAEGTYFHRIYKGYMNRDGEVILRENTGRRPSESTRPSPNKQRELRTWAEYEAAVRDGTVFESDPVEAIVHRLHAGLRAVNDKRYADLLYGMAIKNVDDEGLKRLNKSMRAGAQYVPISSAPHSSSFMRADRFNNAVLPERALKLAGEVYEPINPNGALKTFEAINGIGTSLLAQGDLAATGIQGGIAMFAYPTQFMRAQVFAANAMLDPYAMGDYYLKNWEHLKKTIPNGLSITPQLYAGEFQFQLGMSTDRLSLDLTSPLRGAGKLLGSGALQDIKPSPISIPGTGTPRKLMQMGNLHFSGMGNYLRSEIAKLEATSNFDSWSPNRAWDEMQGINSTTGRYTGAITSAERALLFAPRFFRSQIKNNMDAALSWTWHDSVDHGLLKGNPQAAWELMTHGPGGRARANLIKLFSLSGMVTWASNEARGIDTEWDISKPNGWRIRDAAGLDISLLGPYHAFYRALAAAAKQLADFPEEPLESAMEAGGEIGRLLQGKSGVLVRDILIQVQGHNLVGQPRQQLWKKEAWSDIGTSLGTLSQLAMDHAPISIQNMQQDRNPSVGSVFLNLVGINASSLTRAEQRDLAAEPIIAHEIAAGTLPKNALGADPDRPTWDSLNKLQRDYLLGKWKVLRGINSEIKKQNEQRVPATEEDRQTRELFDSFKASRDRLENGDPDGPHPDDRASLRSILDKEGQSKRFFDLLASRSSAASSEWEMHRRNNPKALLTESDREAYARENNFDFRPPTWEESMAARYYSLPIPTITDVDGNERADYVALRHNQDAFFRGLVTPAGVSLADSTAERQRVIDYVLFEHSSPKFSDPKLNDAWAVYQDHRRNASPYLDVAYEVSRSNPAFAKLTDTYYALDTNLDRVERARIRGSEEWKEYQASVDQAKLALIRRFPELQTSLSVLYGREPQTTADLARPAHQPTKTSEREKLVKDLLSNTASKQSGLPVLHYDQLDPVEKSKVDKAFDAAEALYETKYLVHPQGLKNPISFSSLGNVGPNDKKRNRAAEIALFRSILSKTYQGNKDLFRLPSATIELPGEKLPPKAPLETRVTVPELSARAAPVIRDALKLPEVQRRSTMRPPAFPAPEESPAPLPRRRTAFDTAIETLRRELDKKPGGPAPRSAFPQPPPLE